MIWSTRHVIMCCCFFFWCILAYAETAVNHMTISMRDSGYTIGDSIEMTATFTLPTNQSIDEESLPLVGRVNPWLDIQTIDVKQYQQRVRLHIKWQLFATVEIAQKLKTPELELKTRGETPQKIIIPQQTFYYSPVLPMPPLENINRRDNLTPPYFDTTKPLICLSFCVVLFFIFGLSWLWFKDLLPWFPRTIGPMTKLARQLKPQSNFFTLTQLYDVHAALNKSAGVSLYPDNLSQLFHHAPYFDCVQRNVTLFFNQSWPQFYCNKETAVERIEMASNLVWIKRVAMAERVFRRQYRVKK
jgi:hypothetical protein